MITWQNQIAFKYAQASNIIPVAQVPIQISPVLVYFFIFALTPPRPISVFYILTGTILTIIAGFLLGRRPETPLSMNKGEYHAPIFHSSCSPWSILFSFVTPAAAGNTIRIYYAGPEKNSVYTALTLAPKGTFTFVTDPSQADVFVLNGIIPDPAAVAARLNAGAGVVLILGPDLTSEDVQTALGVPLTLEPHNDAVSLTDIKVNDPLVKQIIWNGAPQVRERSNILTPMSSVQPLVTAYEDGEWVLWSARGGKAFIFNAFLTDGFNPQIQEWAYYNYLIYHLVERAAGQTPLSFADYPGFPGPARPRTEYPAGV